MLFAMATCSCAFRTRLFLASLEAVFFARFKFFAASSVRASFSSCFSLRSFADFNVPCFSMDLAIFFAFWISEELEELCFTDFASACAAAMTADTWDGVRAGKISHLFH